MKEYFPNATSINPICADGVFSFYRVFIPDEEDPDFEQEYLVITDSRDRVVFSGAVLHGSEGEEIFPDWKKTFYMNKLKELVHEIEKKISSRSKFGEKKEIIFDSDYDLYIEVNTVRGYWKLIYSDGNKTNSLLTTSKEEIGALLEQLIEVRSRVFCEC